MVFGIPVIDGQILCPCCADHLWHCKVCWDKYHNGELHKDYEPPKYYGQSMMSDKMHKNAKTEFNIDFMKDVKIKPNKNKSYKEGTYKH